MPCTSTLPMIHNPGWRCTGDDLMVMTTVITGDQRVPLVCPKEYFAEVMRRPEGRAFDAPYPYVFNQPPDHMHMILPLGLRLAHSAPAPVGATGSIVIPNLMDDSNGQLPAIFARLAADHQGSPQEREETRRAVAERRAEIVATQTIDYESAERLVAAVEERMSWPSGYLHHLTQSYCECGDRRDGWFYCAYAIDRWGADAL